MRENFIAKLFYYIVFDREVIVLYPVLNRGRCKLNFQSCQLRAPAPTQINTLT